MECTQVMEAGMLVDDTHTPEPLGMQPISAAWKLGNRVGARQGRRARESCFIYNTKINPVVDEG